jgi:superfamily I DNA/RNA helicase
MAYNRYRTGLVSESPVKKKWYPYKKQEPIVRVPRKTDCEWSEYQSNIFAAIAEGKDNIVVSAVPGSGKTTTITEALYHLPPGLNTLFLAFNKSIATELSARVPEGVECRTTHAMGLKIITNAFGKIDIDNDKGMRISQALVGVEPEKTELRCNLAKAMDLCKGYLATTESDIDVVLDRHGIDADDRDEFISNVMKGLDISAKQNRLIDFGDMIWFAHRHNLTPPQKFDRVFIDETNDLNAAQIDMVIRLVREGGKIIAIGDPRQSIYQFRGADSEAIPNVIARTHARTLPLSVCYRCARSIVELAATIEPSIEAAPNAPEGIVETVSEQSMFDNAQPGDAILSRVNAPLIGYCLQFLKVGRKANIQGRDVGKNLTWMIKKSECNTISEFLAWVDNWCAEQCERLTGKNRDCTHIVDKRDCFYAFAEGCYSLADMKANIEKMFEDTDDNNRILLSSIHRAKGKEWKRVYLLHKTCKPTKGIEEANLTYVGYTRAKSHLMLVE